MVFIQYSTNISCCNMTLHNVTNHNILYYSIIYPVSVRRFPSLRTQPLENITPPPMNKWNSEQPSPWLLLKIGV